MLVLGWLTSILHVNSSSYMLLHKTLQRHFKYMGMVLLSMLTYPVVLKALNDYIQDLNTTLNIIDGAFHFIVDTGCTNSAPPFKKIFKELIDLNHPGKLHGTKGDVIVTQIFGFYSPHKNVHLFAPPPRHTSICKMKKKVELTISWAKTFLMLTKGTVPCLIDKTSFTPFWLAFTTIQGPNVLASPTAPIDDPSFTTLTDTQCLLLRFHLKLGHKDFQCSKWLIRTGLFVPLGVKCGDA